MDEEAQQAMATLTDRYRQMDPQQQMVTVQALTKLLAIPLKPQMPPASPTTSTPPSQRSSRSSPNALGAAAALQSQKQLQQVQARQTGSAYRQQVHDPRKSVLSEAQQLMRLSQQYRLPEIAQAAQRLMNLVR